MKHKLFILMFAIWESLGTMFAQSGICGDNLTWDLNDGVLKISGSGAMNEYNWNSPWYDFKDMITSVIIDEGVTTIGATAFRDFTYLTSCSLPSTIVSIGYEAFCFCFQLMNIAIPASCISVGDNAFNLVPNVSIQDENILGQYSGTRSINGYVEGYFVYDNSAKRSLRACSSSAKGEITLDDAIERIEYMAFAQCEGITKINFGSHLQYVGEWSLNGCIGLESLQFQEGLIEIASNAFGNCFGLKSVELPNSLIALGDFAIGNCPELQTIHFWESLVSVRMQLFDTCPNINIIYAPMTTPPVLDKTAFAATNLSGVICYVPNKSLSLYRQASVWNEMNLQPMETQEPCVTASGNCGAEGNNLIWELSCDGVLTISGAGEMVDYPNNATEPWAEYKTIIKELVVKEGVTSIGDRSFSAGTAHLGEGYKIESLTLPNSLIRIGQFAFFDCTMLTSLQIPESVETIGYAAFYDCNLTSVFIPAGVTKIEKSAFEDNTFLAAMEVDARNNVYDSRENCNAIIETATNTVISGCQNSFIPQGIVAIGDAAFRKCINMTSITFPVGIKTIGPNAFDECSGLTSIELPEGVTAIGDIAFHSCVNVTSVTLPNSLTNIGASAFANCRKLTSVTIPRKVTALGNLCFAVGKSLTTVNFESFTPPAIGDGCFDNYSCMYYVPCGAQNAYVKALGVYSGRVIELNPFNYSYSATSADNTKGTVTIIQEPIPCIIHAVTFRADAVNGYRFEYWSDGNTDNPRTIELTQDTILIAFFAPLSSDIVLQENKDADYYTQFAEDYNGYTVNTATLNRQFTQDEWSTLCLPFNVNKSLMIALGLNGRVYEFRYAEQLDDVSIQMYFAPAQSIEAGKGYIVNANAKLAQKTSLVFPNVTIHTDADNGDITALTGYNDNSGRGNLYLAGTLRAGVLQGSANGNTYLGLKDNKLYYPNSASGTAIRAYRGFFRSSEPMTAQRVRIILDGEGMGELIIDNGQLTMDNEQPVRKYIENGIIYIRCNGKTYNAQGLRID